MSRIRCIKPEFAEDEVTNGKLSVVARLAYILSWPLCDDKGRMRGSKAYLKANLFPYDNTPAFIKEFDAAYEQLIRLGKWVAYVVNGQQYIYLPNFLKHQRIQKPSASKIPDPDDTSMVGLSESYCNATGGVSTGMEGEGEGEVDREGKDMRVGFAADTIPRNEIDKTSEEKHTMEDTNWSQDGFLEFWELYPIKEDRKRAESAWRNKVRKKHIPLIMADVERRIELTARNKANGKFTPRFPNPTTYLNNRRWEDEPTETDDYEDEVSAMSGPISLERAKELWGEDDD